MSTVLEIGIEIALNHNIAAETVNGDTLDVQAVPHAFLTLTAADGDAVIPAQQFGRVKEINFVDDAGSQS